MCLKSGLIEMKTANAITLLALFGCLPALGYTDLGNHVLQSNGTASDTQAAINAASDGSIVRIPAGTFAWYSGLTVFGKGVKIQGAGGSSLLGDSTTSL